MYGPYDPSRRPSSFGDSPAMDDQPADDASAFTWPTQTLAAPAVEQEPVQEPVIVTPPPAPVVIRQGARWWQTGLAAVLGAVLAVGGLQLVEGDESISAAAPAIAVAAAEAPSDEGVAEAAVPAESAVPDTVVPSLPSPTDLTPAPSSADAVAVGAKVIPSIVTVEVLGNGRIVGSGSGVIITADGYIVTNDHVVAGGQGYQVVLSDGRTTYSASLVGTDPLTDLAVLDIAAEGLTPIEYGSAAALSVGDAAVAVGSPLGLEGGPSLTVGVVSAFGRQVQTSATDVLYGMLQTDAPITSGSSGGALVDGAGRLIGITTAVGVSDVGVEGIGFATPIEIVTRIVDELVAEGDVGHAFLGISGITSFDAAADGARVAAGVEVGSVGDGSAAANAGLQAGDVITSIDGLRVETMDELIVALRVRFPGDDVQLTVNGSDVTVTLGVR
ncbi:MAG: trypsin-like peptidase domain-containing protein [Acidimicrobiia bacterium]|nr:trypsin-like peptidase domain-containing protein [Acidimicrobiia bacterium]